MRPGTDELREHQRGARPRVLHHLDRALVDLAQQPGVQHLGGRPARDQLAHGDDGDPVLTDVPAPGGDGGTLVPTPQPSGGLALTGASTWGLTAGGALLVLLGVGLLAVRRARPLRA